MMFLTDNDKISSCLFQNRAFTAKLLRPCKVQQPTANCFLSVAITPVKDVIRLVGMGYCTLHIALCIVALGATDMTGSVYEEWGINTIQVTTEGM